MDAPSSQSSYQTKMVISAFNSFKNPIFFYFSFQVFTCWCFVFRFLKENWPMSFLDLTQLSHIRSLIFHTSYCSNWQIPFGLCFYIWVFEFRVAIMNWRFPLLFYVNVIYKCSYMFVHMCVCVILWFTSNCHNLIA